MYNRIFTGWTLTRAIYVLIGGATAISAIMDANWLFAVIGLFFASMGIFGLGCAGKNCATNTTSYQDAPDPDTVEVDYEEVK